MSEAKVKRKAGRFLNWADEAKIDFTRSRLNRKNDNAFVEQKNGPAIRRFWGTAESTARRRLML